MILELADCPQSLLVRGQISDTKLGKLFGVDRGTVRRWRLRTPGAESQFHPEFAAACNTCQEAVDEGRIKRSMVERAQGFVQKKRIRQAGEDGKLMVVKEEVVTMAGDVQAAKLVLNNIGKKDWNTAEKTDNTHHINELDELLEAIDGKTKGVDHGEPV
jgi:hypothetical protein